MTALGSNPTSAPRQRDQDDVEIDQPSGRAARTRSRPRWFTNERTVAGVMSALAGYFIFRAETRPAQIAPAPDLAPITASVEQLKTDVRRVEDKVDDIKDAVTLLQVNSANNEFRLQRVEAETASIKARRQ